MENVCEKVDKHLTGHIEETDGRIGRITEELKTKTQVLEVNFSQNVEIKNNDIQSIR